MEVEREKRFSESIVWRLQRRFYEALGPAAWTVAKLPSFGTSNPLVAHVYAQVVLAYLREAVAGATLDPKQPVHIVEIGSGSGQFGYLFLRELHALRSASSLRALDVRYVMTDLAASNVRAWQAQPLFEPFLRAGQLLMGRFDAEADEAIGLVGGGTVAAATVGNPLIVVANYVFDTLVHDTFRVRDGTIFEGRLTIRAPRPIDPEPSRPEDLDELRSRYTYHPLAQDAYADPELSRIVEGYRARLADGHFSIPVGGLTAIRRLLEIGRGRMLLLCSDKGYTHEDELAELGGHTMEVHGGAFSVMVNLHAIGQYVAGRGGLYASTARRRAPLKTALFLLGGDADRFADTLVAFGEHADTLSPFEYFTLLGQTHADCPKLGLEHFLALLRLSRFDPKVVVLFGADVVEQVRGATEWIRAELRWALERAWGNFYPIGEDLPFLLGRFFLALDRPLEAIRCNLRSIELFGAKWDAYVNLGVAYLLVEDHDHALRCLDRAVELAPDSDFAKGWRNRAHAALERARAARRPQGL